MECERDQHSRGVGETQDAQEDSPFICYHYFEPFSDSVHVQSFKVQLNMENATINYNDKIWFF